MIHSIWISIVKVIKNHGDNQGKNKVLDAMFNLIFIIIQKNVHKV